MTSEKLFKKEEGGETTSAEDVKVQKRNLRYFRKESSKLELWSAEVFLCNRISSHVSKKPDRIDSLNLSSHITSENQETYSKEIDVSSQTAAYTQEALYGIRGTNNEQLCLKSALQSAADETERADVVVAQTKAWAADLSEEGPF